MWSSSDDDDDDEGVANTGPALSVTGGPRQGMTYPAGAFTPVRTNGQMRTYLTDTPPEQADVLHSVPAAIPAPVTSPSPKTWWNDLFAPAEFAPAASTGAAPAAKRVRDPAAADSPASVQRPQRDTRQGQITRRDYYPPIPLVLAVTENVPATRAIAPAGHTPDRGTSAIAPAAQTPATLSPSRSTSTL